MADVNGTPAPATGGQANPSEAPRDWLPREAPRDQQQQKREKNRNRKKKLPAAVPVDGAVSDSVVKPTASPKPVRQAKQRQSVAGGPVPAQNGYTNGNTAMMNGAKGRPASLAGPMLPGTPAKEQAYAGPTFHASPAPSSLPMPKFFSKSVPNDGGSLQARMEAEKTPERQESSPEPDVVSPIIPPEGVQSPLDMFFKADKEEKQRKRSSGGFLSPEMAARRPTPATEPRNSQQFGKSIFLRELDGNEDDMPSPRTVPAPSRPPVERAHSSPGIKSLTMDDEATKSLKELLFNSVNAASPPHHTPPQQPQQRAQSDAQIFNTPSPIQQRSSSGPSTPAPSAEQPNHYALHYGNRNLSPLFRATRGDTPSRPSSLRQELPNGDAPPFPNNHQPPPRHIPQLDSNTFSRSYLDQHIRTSKPASLPQLPFRTGAPTQASPDPVAAPSAPDTVSGPPPAAPPPQRNAPRGVSMVPGNSARTNGSRDIGSMEDDLRRILKLSV